MKSSKQRIRQVGADINKGRQSGQRPRTRLAGGHRFCTCSRAVLQATQTVSLDPAGQVL